MIHRRSWLGAVLAAQLVSVPVYAQWDWTGQAPPSPPIDDGVWVELLAPSPVQLERVQGDMVYPVCAAPCRQRVPRRGVYRIGGDSVVPSASFDLTEEPLGVTLAVHPASALRKRAGMTLGLVGLGMLIAGAAIQQRIENQRVEGLSPGHSEQVAGDALLLSGLAMGVVGLVFLLTTQTRVTSSNGVSF